MNEAMTFSDVAITPKYSDIEPRSSVSLYSELGKGFNLRIPLIASNMPSIMNSDLAYYLHRMGCGAILHRFQSIESAAKEFSELKNRIDLEPPRDKPFNIGVSVGVKNDDDIERAMKLYLLGARIFCVDVAHGHHNNVRKMLGLMNRRIKSIDPTVFFIAGNICTPEAAKDLEDWGADCIKVGIGSSSKICSTRIDTGVGIPQLTALERCREATSLPIICDGGCYQTGDFAKALKYADAVMSGSLFAGTSLASGRIRHSIKFQRYFPFIGIEKQKEYYGSASLKNKKEKKHIEGRTVWIPHKGETIDVIRKTEEGLKSAFSYVGAETLEEFKELCLFEKISFGGHHEGVR